MLLLGVLKLTGVLSDDVMRVGLIIQSVLAGAPHAAKKNAQPRVLIFRIKCAAVVQASRVQR